MKTLKCDVCGEETSFADDGTQVEFCACMPKTTPEEDEHERQAKDQLQRRLDAIDKVAAKEIELLEGVEGPDAKLRRFFVGLNREVRTAIELWQFEVGPGVLSAAETSDIFLSLAGDLISSSLLNVRHMAAEERRAMFFKAMDQIVQKLIRQKLIPPLPDVGKKQIGPQILMPSGKPFKRQP